MATTTKTLTPTNQTITLPDMTERPNASVLVDGIGKDADAINALSTQLVVWTTVTLSYASSTALENRNVTIPTGKSIFRTVAAAVSYDSVSVKSNSAVMRVGTVGFRIQGSGFVQGDTLDVIVGWYN